MSRLRLRKPSPAMAVALVALVVSLGGTAAAAGFGPFEGNEIIKKKSLSGNRLKKHSVSGNRLQGHTIEEIAQRVKRSQRTVLRVLAGVTDAAAAGESVP